MSQDGALGEWHWQVLCDRGGGVGVALRAGERGQLSLLELSPLPSKQKQAFIYLVCL